MSEANILTVEGLSVTLDGIQVLRDVSFTVQSGEALALRRSFELDPYVVHNIMGLLAERRSSL